MKAGLFNAGQSIIQLIMGSTVSQLYKDDLYRVSVCVLKGLEGNT